MKWTGDVVIVGAGIAGLSIAKFLSRHKLKICLIDQKENFENVTFYTLASFIDLEKFGLSRNIIASAPTEIYFHSAHVCIKKSSRKIYILLDKKKLHQEFLKSIIKNGVEIFQSTKIINAVLGSTGLVSSLIDNKGNEYKAKIFIDASGLSGVLSKRFDLQDKKLNIATGLEYNVKYYGSQNQTHLFFGKTYQGGYAWIFPFGGDRAIFGFGSSDLNVKSTLKKRIDAMFEVGVIKNLIKKDNEKLNGGTIPVTDVKTKFVYSNVVCIGDCVSLVNPIVGEGYRFIIEASYIAAPYIYKSIANNNLEMLYQYELDWKNLFYKNYRWSKRFQKLAFSASNNDLLSDILTLILATKRSKTFINLLAGRVTLKNIFIP